MVNKITKSILIFLMLILLHVILFHPPPPIFPSHLLLSYCIDLYNLLLPRMSIFSFILSLFREIDQYLPRIEVKKVDGLRAQWETLTNKADVVKHVLLCEKRQDYESEVDKQVKSFGVETIRFRNSFDSEGPLVPGLRPNIAVERLGMLNWINN